MTLEWIIERLKVSGNGTKQEVLNALEHASDKDLLELTNSCLTKVLIPFAEKIVNVFNSEDFKEKLKEYMEMLHSGTNGETN